MDRWRVPPISIKTVRSAWMTSRFLCRSVVPATRHPFRCLSLIVGPVDDDWSALSVVVEWASSMKPSIQDSIARLRKILRPEVVRDPERRCRFLAHGGEDSKPSGLWPVSLRELPDKRARPGLGSGRRLGVRGSESLVEMWAGVNDELSLVGRVQRGRFCTKSVRNNAQDGL